MIDLKGLKIQLIDKTKLRPNARNPRLELNTESIDDTLRDPKTTIGIKKPLVVFDDGEIGQGHRRWTAAMKFPHIETVPAFVLKKADLTEVDILDVLMDHNEEDPLSKAECFLAIRPFFSLSFGDGAIIRRCKILLNSSFGSPAPEKIKDARREAEAMREDPDAAENKVVFDKHHGTIQNFRRLANLPENIQQEYLRAWQGRNSDLTQKDIKILSDYWNELIKADPSVTRENPPTAFGEKVEALKEINKKPDAKKAGVTKRTKTDIENMFKAIENALVRRTLSWALGEITDGELIEFVKNN
jgi:hypothetical protein